MGCIEVVTETLSFKGTSTDALIFVPDASARAHCLGVFSHGYTSHKGSLLAWASKLGDGGLPVVLFDLPGHYLGNFSEVEDFHDFAHDAPGLFFDAYEKLEKAAGRGQAETIILGGHSLGALLSLKALGRFVGKKTLNVCVGLGMPGEGTHVYDTPFYRQVIDFRGSLVSKALGPQAVFPWVKREKESLCVSGATVYLLCGQDDLVVGVEGADRLKTHLEAQHNRVFLEKPRRLAHHEPEGAAVHIKRFLSERGLL